MDLTPHCHLCFTTLLTDLSHPLTPSPSTKSNLISQIQGTYPLFVTWKLSSNLRGCIGTFSPQPLSTGLQTYARAAAFQDRRFSPISASEVPQLRVGVSLLVDFEPATGYTDWIVGTHGIWIEFGDGVTATYLPEVAGEQGWTHVEALDSLLRKGGFRGRITEDVRRGVKVTRYRSVKKEVSWEEYRGYIEGL
ncbi:AMME syndrome candidate protein 1 protein [Rhizoclosmatium sp. JEL0117]|nr:AMME syndrome candidate protein 1 protein [Rhizoclosmatium sp. JEL0117]